VFAAVLGTGCCRVGFAATMAIVALLIHSTVDLQSADTGQRGDVRRHADPWMGLPVLESIRQLSMNGTCACLDSNVDPHYYLQD
jgi:hypothetical protein